MVYTEEIWCWNHAKPTGFEPSVLHIERSQIGLPVPLLVLWTKFELPLNKNICWMNTWIKLDQCGDFTYRGRGWKWS